MLAGPGPAIADEKGSRTLSTSLQPTQDSSLKQEVSRRLAAHRSRRSDVSAVAVAAPSSQRPQSRASLAAARVAERFAKAPSYSELPAIEARAALRAAELATQAALEAQAEARVALDSLQAAVIADSHAAAQPVDRHNQDIFDEPFFTEEQRVADLPANGGYASPSRWEDAVPQLPAAQSYQPAFRLSPAEPVISSRSRWEEEDEERLAPQLVEPVAPLGTGPANLIEFPREIVAPAKSRPRRIEQLEPSYESGQQLSIFEVDPAALSQSVYEQPLPQLPACEQHAAVAEPLPPVVEPAMAAPAVTLPVPAPASAPEFTAWKRPIWSDVELDERTLREELDLVEKEAAERKAPIEQAGMGRRLLAPVIDLAAISTLCLVAAFVGLRSAEGTPSLHMVECCMGTAALIIAFLYECFFLGVVGRTPGMKYAGLRLRTFEDRTPTGDELRMRLFGLLLAAAPAGAGFLWTLFDKQHLGVHDRISHTYMRKK